jgi:hypothetical protein
MIPTGDNRSTRKGPCSRTTSSTTNPTRTDLGLKPVLHGERPANSRLSSDTFYYGTVTCVYSTKFVNFMLVKGKAICIQAWTGPEGSRRLRIPEFQDSRHRKATKLSALGTGRLYLPGDTPGTHFC